MSLILPLVVAFVIVGFGSYLGCRQALKEFFGESQWEMVKEQDDT